MATVLPLVDTNVVSELARARPNAGVLEWAERVQRVAISVVSLEKIECALAWQPNERVHEWFATFVEESCQVSIT